MSRVDREFADGAVYGSQVHRGMHEYFDVAWDDAVVSISTMTHAGLAVRRLPDGRRIKTRRFAVAGSVDAWPTNSACERSGLQG
jgi:hypothetical protein